MSSIDRSVRSSARRWPAVGLAGLIAMGLAGCGGGGSPLDSMTFYPVKGKVVLPGGKPLTSGKVVFVATESSLTCPAEIGGDGTFELKGRKDGLPAGNYKVRIEAGESSPSPPGARGAAARQKGAVPFPTRYLDEDSSGLTAAVKPEGPNEFTFTLAR